jgi:phosphoribosylformylglycinamidine cyclo-ligase
MRYSDAGVDIDRAEVFKKEIKKMVRRTFNSSVLSDIGLFGGLYGFGKDTVLVSSIDGVGTKSMIAKMMGKHEVIGYDVIGHGSNDIVVQGARPLFCLDYIGTSKLDHNIAIQLIKGMVKACKDVGCALIGGETAQMPGVYQEEEYDLVGCMVGVVEKNKIINGKKIKPGHVVVGLSSTGLHTNGYSLARKILLEKHDVHHYVPELKTTIGDALLKPHKSYSKFILELRRKIEIKGLAHITGGGLIDNVPRILPENTMVVINKDSWNVPPLFNLIQEWGNVPDDDMYRTFNMGIGMVVIADKKDADKIKGGRIIGHVERGPAKCVVE